MIQMMNNWLFPVLLGFFLGSTGYILYRFYFKPIMKYKRIKRKIQKSLAPLATETLTTHKQVLGSLASEISSCYTNDLPVWFRLALTRRKEDPQAAAAHLLTLAKTKNPDHARRRIQQIEETLKITI